MRTKIVAGNWKMNKTIGEAETLVSSVIGMLKKSVPTDTLVIFSPPFTSLKAVSDKITGVKNIFTAAQNCHWEEKGAFTGEISASMIAACGAKYVLLGHSERRMYFKEKNDVLARKTDLALKNGLVPVFCCGESLAERRNNHHFAVVKKQIEKAVFHLPVTEFNKLIIAYEPVWAIGTGENATPAQAQEMHSHIRKLIVGKYGSVIAENVTLLYGGSCNPSNAKELFSMPDIDGGLIGGASLKAEDFVAIVNSLDVRG